MNDDSSHPSARNHASLPSLRTDDAVSAALDEERRARRARIATTLRFGLLVSIGLLFGSCGLILASGGRSSNGVGQRTAAWVELAQADAEFDCRHTPVAFVHEACLAPARKLGDEWDRDPTPPAWAVVGDRLARFFGLSQGIIDGGGVLEPALAIRLVRGSLLMRHARGLPPIADVNDARDRLAILDENSSHVLFAEPGIFAFLRGALHDPLARERALTVLLDERLRADTEFLSATRFPTSSARVRAPSDTPMSALAERFAHLQKLATLDDDAIRAARVGLDADARLLATAAAHEGHEPVRTPPKLAQRSFTELAWNAHGGGSIGRALWHIDERFAHQTVALARFLAPARAQLDDGSGVSVLPLAARSEQSAASAAAVENQRLLITDLLLAMGQGSAREAACERLLVRALSRKGHNDFAVRPVIGCPVPSDIAARLATLKNPSVDGDGPVLNALAALYGDTLLHPVTKRPRETARAAVFQMQTGLQPFVFEREQKEAGGLVPPSLNCGISVDISKDDVDVDFPCAERALTPEMREVRAFVRAE